MLLRLLLAVALVAGLAGCSTMKKTSRTDEMNTRIGDLEGQLDAKDTEIAQLKGEVQELSEQIKMKQALSSGAASSEGSEMASSASSDGAIRVKASPRQVQLALQGAGFYSGPVDGKIGAKTRKAISEFQRAHNLKADGVIGKQTWTELKTYLD